MKTERNRTRGSPCVEVNEVEHAAEKRKEQEKTYLEQAELETI